MTTRINNKSSPIRQPAMNTLTARNFSNTSLGFYTERKQNLHKLRHVAAFRGATPADLVFCGALREQPDHATDGAGLTSRKQAKLSRGTLAQEENLCNNSQQFQEILSEEIQVALKSNRNVLEQCRTEFKTELDKKSPRRLPTRPLFRFSRPLLHTVSRDDREVSKSPQVQKFEQNQTHQKTDPVIKSSSIRRTKTSKHMLPQLGESPLKHPIQKKLTLSPHPISPRGVLKSRNSIALVSTKARTELRNTLSALLKGKCELKSSSSLRRMNTSRPFSSTRTLKKQDLLKQETKSRNGETVESNKTQWQSAVSLKRSSFFKTKSPSLDSLAQRREEKSRRKIIGLGGLTQCMTSAELRETIARGVRRLATQLSTE